MAIYRIPLRLNRLVLKFPTLGMSWHHHHHHHHQKHLGKLWANKPGLIESFVIVLIEFCSHKPRPGLADELARLTVIVKK